MDAFGWDYDPSNPLSREEQREKWQQQAEKNVLVKKSAKAFEKELSAEEKKAKWKADKTGLVAKTLGALTHVEKKKVTQKQADYMLGQVKN